MTDFRSRIADALQSLRLFQRGKLYDLLAALPMIVWYLWRLWQRLPQLKDAFTDARFAPNLLHVLDAIAEIGIFAFVFAVIAAFVLRVAPHAKAQGLLPRLVALAGTFATLLFVQLPLADLSLPAQTLATALVVGGSLLGIYVIAVLGRSFSIMAEARVLKTHGPYALVRHPLYFTEELVVLGAAIQYRQPWGAALFLVHLGLQIWRMHNEERVLAAAYPDYAAYAARTARLIPGIY
jgi:protein-S-isoprenylcysteine O-methyltransferase Ste14